jgi:hypothetical protein
VEKDLRHNEGLPGQQSPAVLDFGCWGVNMVVVVEIPAHLPSINNFHACQA